MNDITFAQSVINELEAETTSTRKCLERFDMELFDYRPHRTSMQMGYLALLCAEIPLWIDYMVKTDGIDFATFEHLHPKTTEEMVQHFDNNVEKAKQSLAGVTDGVLSEKFDLKSDGKVVFSATKRENIESVINHMVHHRGQLTVYMRMNEIAVPSIYGPSADEKVY